MCYRYFYDDHGRITEKQLPGKAADYLVYDQRDRLVLSQDGNQRAINQWSYTVYDALNRPLFTGMDNSGNSIGSQIYMLNNMSINNYAPYDLGHFLLNNDLHNETPASLSMADIYTMNYYDDYNFNNPSLNGFAYTTAYNNRLTGTTGFDDAPALAASGRTKGLMTASLVRVLDPSAPAPTWLPTVNYYNEKGRLVQQQSKNYVGGDDITTNQYDFQGTLISSALHHTNNIVTDPNYTTTEIVKRYTKNHYNGGITQIEQNINNVGFRVISSNTYDQLGRLGNKTTGAASNDYTYNIRGWLAGINDQHMDGGPGGPDFFHEQLFYSHGYGKRYYNGNISGMIWRGNGTTKRSYGYYYDELNRLTDADFGEYTPNSPPPGLWPNTITDFTASNISYDYNGNIQSMNQRGIGIGGPVDMDLLTYHYFNHSNQLRDVTENSTATTIANSPDFKGINTSGDDYHYDPNGNLDQDLNKKIGQGNTNFMTYSYLNKPTHIPVDPNTQTTSAGTIDYIYDAAGNKLVKKVQLNAATGTGPGLTTTYYSGPFIYETGDQWTPVTQLQMILHEEGRCRPANNIVNGVAVYDYDYFVKDHLGNVRSVIKTELSGLGPQNPLPPGLPMVFKAGLEVASSNTESLIWSHLDDVRADNPLITDAGDVMAAELDGSDPNKRIGTAMLLRVMPGDQFTLNAQSYYEAQNGNNGASVEDLAGSLLSALGGGVNTSEGGDGGAANALIVNNTIGSPEFINGYNDLMNNADYDENQPAVFLNYLVFDEHFNLIPSNSGVIQASGPGTQWNNFGTNGLVKIAQPGYVAVFSSSRTNSPMFVNNVDMTYYKGTVLEENHYYPFGLTVTTPANGNPTDNNYKYNGIELNRDLNLETYTAYYRNLDPQIGRWWQIDPKVNYSESIYASMGNNPSRFSDILGDTLSNDGFKENKVLKDMNRGLRVKTQNSPYSFVNGKLSIDDAKTSKLNDRQKEIVKNIKAVVDDKTNFILTKVSPNFTLPNGETLSSKGGAATVGIKSSGGELVGDVRIYWDGDSHTRGTLNNEILYESKTSIIYHEIGGHSFYKYVEHDPQQAGKTVDYENKVRQFDAEFSPNNTIRQYDDEHPKPKNDE